MRVRVQPQHTQGAAAGLGAAVKQSATVRPVPIRESSDGQQDADGALEVGTQCGVKGAAQLSRHKRGISVAESTRPDPQSCLKSPSPWENE